jgi:SAM-dependent methyltransferase
MQIEDMLESWSLSDRRREPPILGETWRGTEQSPMLVTLWGEQYARAYGWMLSLGITSRLWDDFTKLVCAEFKQGIVFDAGIGQGDVTRLLLDARPDVRVIGGDWSIPFLQRAQKNLAGQAYKGRVALCQMDLTQSWPAEWQESFDGVFCNYVAAYMPIENQKTLLSEAFRVLRKDGVLFINFMIRHIEFRDVLRKNIPAELKRNPFFLLRAMLLIPIFTTKVDKARNTNLIQSFAPEEFEETARATGFRDVSIVGWHLPLSAESYAVPTYRLVK